MKMKQEMMNEIGVLLAFTVLDLGVVLAADKMRLSDIMVLTLHNGRTTNSRRSQPIPQLKCTGGSAGCSSYVPQVVQCYNRGSDGYDVQWECKTDMDNAFRFGRVEVSCEGYEYPDDPNVLRGSCGCEYTLDLTQEGYQKKSHRNQDHHNYYEDEGYSNHDNSYQSGHSYSFQKSASAFGDVIMLVIIGLVVYAIYKTCTGTNQSDYTENGSMDNDSDDRPSGGDRRGHYGGGGSPPQPGFRSNNMPGGGGCGGTSAPSHGTTGGGGFWTGAATGGILGYLLGNTGRRNTGYGGYGYARPYSSWGSSWGSSGFGSGFGRSAFGGGSSGSSSYSSGTRSASGFGGTRRR